MTDMAAQAEAFRQTMQAQHDTQALTLATQQQNALLAQAQRPAFSTAGAGTTPPVNRDRMLIEDAAAVAGTMVATEVYARHCQSKGKDPDRGATLATRGFFLVLALSIVIGLCGAQALAAVLFIGAFVLYLPVLFTMMRHTSSKGTR